MSKYLSRDDAPFGAAVWQRIDEVVVQSARSVLSVRRLLHVDGPFGLGFKAFAGGDHVVESAGEGAVNVIASESVPLATLASTFTLARRDLAAFEENNALLNMAPVAEAALAVARQEDDVLLHGSKALGVSGLLTAKGVQTAKLSPWTSVGKAAEDVIAAVTQLDAAGFHGPYALALGPERYNLLLRRYPQGNATEMEHLRQIVSEGILKAPALGAGGMLVATGRQFASIVLGQDLAAGFVGPMGQHYEFTISESLALRLLAPASVCVLK